MAVGNAKAPFLDFKSFVTEEGETREPEAPAMAAIRSPFASVYESAEGESPFADPVREAYSSFVDELHDEEFDEALFELLTEARNMHQDHLASGYSAAEADRVVAQRFAQLARESEGMVDGIAREFESRSGGAIVEGELESFYERYSSTAQVEPAFENFFGKLFKKIGKVVKTVAGKAWQGIKTLGIGAILGRIKGFIQPVLNRVLQKAIGKLPEPLQPAAQKLAEKLGFAPPKPAEPAPAPEPAENAGASVQAAAGSDVAAVQKEFDEQIAGAMLARDEAEFSMELSALRNSSATAAPVFANLDEARDQFINELDNLKAGESTEPYVQNFIPAVLPALRLGMRLIGRPRVVNFLAQLLAKLISRLIGPEQAPALSRAIVDAGLKLLTLEVSEQEKSGLAASSVAATVEETINRVASLPEHILDNQELLEGFALEAFEQAAAANLPAVLSEATYRERPELLEAGVDAAWILMPLRGRKRYKRCTRPFRVSITPQMAEEIESFEDVPLSEYLQDQLGLPEGAEVEGELHLFETLPGGTVADIARSETETPGLGASDEATFSQLHPLTRQAAAALLGRPGLGRNLIFGSYRHHVAPGQRLFHLALRGRRPLTIVGRWGRRHVRRLFHINVTLDYPQDQLRACVYISEVKAQKLAVRMREQAHIGSLTVAFNKFVARRLPRILHGFRPKRLRIVHPGIPAGQSPDALLQKLPGIVPQTFISKVQEWLVQGFSDFAKTQAQKFLAAAEDPADGVTLRFTIEHPQGLKELGQALLEKGAAAGAAAAAVGQAAQPAIHVEVFPGHKCD